MIKDFLSNMYIKAQIDGLYILYCIKAFCVNLKNKLVNK